MVSKEFFEFISAHCGNVVAWLLILWPFVHLALLIQTFSRTVFNEVLWLIDMGLGGKGQWITAIKITCIKLYLHLLIFSNLSIIYFGIPIGTILFVLVVATFIIHIIDISIEDKTLSEDLPGIIRMVIYFVLFVAIMLSLIHIYALPRLICGITKVICPRVGATPWLAENRTSIIQERNIGS